MKKKLYWEVKYFIDIENRYGLTKFWSNNPEQWIKNMEKSYPNVDFYEYRQLHPNPTP